MHLVDGGRGVAERLGQPLRELKAHVEAMRPDVEQQVPGRRHGMVPIAGQIPERVQCRRARFAGQPIPEFGSDSDDD